MEKAEFHGGTPTAKQEQETRERLARLSADPRILHLLQEQAIPAAELRQYPTQFDRWLLDQRRCEGCRGLGQCKQKQRGMVPDLFYDGILQPVLHPCAYLTQQEQRTAHLAGYLVNDMDPRLATVSFDAIDVSHEDADYLQVLKAALNAVQKEEGLYLYGNMGTGKTYLAVCASNYYAKSGRRTAFVHWPTAVRRMRDALEDGEYRTELNRLTYAPFLVIDDIGAESVTAWNRDDILLPLLNARMEAGRMTWFTSNEDFKTLENHFSVTSRGIEERQKAMRILERIQKLAKPLEIIGSDRRRTL